MRPLRALTLSVLASVLLIGTSMAQRFAPTVRIVNPIDETQLVTLTGNTHPAATARNDRGPVSPTLAMTDLILVLSRSPEQQAAFDKFVAAQYDSNSPDYHHWLEPEEVGANFGPSQVDIATISNWLTGHGLTIDEVSKDRMSIHFSGTAGQVESAFHTEIHNLEVKSGAHIGNMSDPQIPAALAPAVVGVKALHNFYARPQHKLGSLVQKDSTTGKWQRVASTTTPGTETAGKKLGPNPLYGINVPASGSGSAFLEEDVAPYDFAAMYNVLPLWNAATPINGTGQTIAIAGTTLINLSDVANFRSVFGLPAGLTPEQINANGTAIECTSTDPTAACGINDLIENSLDVEWSGAVAPGAQVVLVASGVTSPSTDTVYTSSDYVIQHNTAKILSVSYGECELGEGTSGNVAYYDLWQTAATEGIAVFVATGDSGAPSCDDGGDYIGNPYSAQYGLSVSGLASTPYNTAVGGTDLNWCNQLTQYNGNLCPAAPYWNTTNNATTGASAAGYVPEVPWNDSCASPQLLTTLEAVAKSASYSGVSDAESACNFIQNDWTLYAEQGEDIAALIDTVGGSGGASGCVVNSTNPDGTSFGTCTVGSTTTGTANGSITLVNNGWPKPSWQTGVSGIPADGVRDIPDVSLFAGNGELNSATLVCVSAVGACVAPPLTGVTSEPTAQELGGTSVGTPEMAGVMALINQKTGVPQGNPNAQFYALAAKQNYASCSSESVKASGSCYFNDVDQGTNDMPCDYGATEGGVISTAAGLEAGPTYAGIVSPNCTVIHSGDLVGLLTVNGSDAYNATAGFDLATGLGTMNVANVVNSFVSQVGTGKAAVTVTPASTTINSNVALTVTVTVASSPAGGTTPTGIVSLSSGVNTTPMTATLTSGSATFTIPSNTLTVGTDTLTVNYDGDSNYASATGTATVTVTSVALLPATVSVSPSANSIESAQSLTVTGAVTGTGGTATGTVILTGGGYTSASATLSGGQYSIAIPGGSLASGTDTLTVSYTPASGSVYSANTGTATVTVTASVFTVGASAPAAISSPGGSTTSTVTVTAANGYAGTVTVTCALTGEASQGDIDPPSCSVGGGGTVTLSAGTTSGTAQVTISSTAATGALVYPKLGGGKGWAGAGGGAVLALLLFLGIPVRRRSWRTMVGMLVLMVMLGSLAGCGGGGSSTPTGTTPDTYTFTVTASGSPAVTPVPSTSFSVTVN